MVNPIHAKVKAMFSNKTDAKIAQQQIGLLNLFNRQEVTIVATDAKRNEAAFMIGVLGGLFGLLGIAHIFNHNIPRGLAWLIFGTGLYWVFLLIVAAILSSIANVLIVIEIAIHLLVIWKHSNHGARIDTKTAPKKKQMPH